MSLEHDIAESTAMSRARRAYELGRLRAALLRASLLGVMAGLASSLWVEPGAWAWAPVTVAIWSFVYWRGGPLLTGARYGLAAGALTFMLPVSLLRPCCRAEMAALTSPCTMPEMCVLAGALVGLPVAFLVLRRGGGRPLQLAAGIALGALSLAAIKCSALFVGEALGLLAGVALGIAATTALHVGSPRHA